MGQHHEHGVGAVKGNRQHGEKKREGIAQGGWTAQAMHGQETTQLCLLGASGVPRRREIAGVGQWCAQKKRDHRGG